MVRRESLAHSSVGPRTSRLSTRRGAHGIAAFQLDCTFRTHTVTTRLSSAGFCAEEKKHDEDTKWKLLLLLP